MNECENQGCTTRSERYLLIDNFGFKIRCCKKCYDKIFKQIYGEPEEEKKERKIRFIKDSNFN